MSEQTTSQERSNMEMVTTIIKALVAAIVFIVVTTWTACKWVAENAKPMAEKVYAYSPHDYVDRIKKVKLPTEINLPIPVINFRKVDDK